MDTYYKTLDTAGEGILSKEELKKGCLELDIRISDKDIELIFSRYDRNRSGTMRYQDFIERVIEKNLENKKDRMKCKGN
jgi:Ca2+-binding EF-hand superfamily protein